MTLSLESLIRLTHGSSFRNSLGVWDVRAGHYRLRAFSQVVKDLWGIMVSLVPGPKKSLVPSLFVPEIGTAFLPSTKTLSTLLNFLPFLPLYSSPLSTVADSTTKSLPLLQRHVSQIPSWKLRCPRQERIQTHESRKPWCSLLHADLPPKVLPHAGPPAPAFTWALGSPWRLPPPLGGGYSAGARQQERFPQAPEPSEDHSRS